MGKSKGKEIAGSSSVPQKRARKAHIIDTDSESEEEAPTHMEESSEEEGEDEVQVEKPEWTGRVPLSNFDPIWQADLYLDKMHKVESIKKVLVCERAIELADFQPFGIVGCFERLGWEETLTFNNNNKDEVYMDAIVEWMSTLEKVTGRNPPQTTKLIGKVRGKEAVMSFETLGKIVGFDSKPDRNYDYPVESTITGNVVEDAEWAEMLAELFAVVPGFAGDKLMRSNLKPIPKLLTLILGSNIIPRLGDKTKVRHYDIRVLYALVTGRPMLSIRQLIMMNIWESRESLDRKMIPHCRLISCLLLKQKVIRADAPSEKIKQQKFSLSKLNPQEWRYERTPRYHILTDVKSGRVVQGLREDAESGSEEEEEGGGGDGGDGRYQAGGTSSHAEAAAGVQTPPHRGHRGEEENTINEAIQYGRPSSYNRWSPYEQLCWDRQTREMEVGRRWRQAEEARGREAQERQEQHDRSQAYAREQDYNRRYSYDEEVRAYHDYHAGTPHQEHPRPVEWSTLPPYEQGQQYQPWPQSYPSEWVPQGDASSGSDAYNMQTMHYSLMESIFGPPIPRPPYDDNDDDEE